MGAVSVEAILSGRGAAQVNAADRDGVFLGTATATEQIELVAVSASVCRAGGVAQLVSLFSVIILETLMPKNRAILLASSGCELPASTLMLLGDSGFIVGMVNKVKLTRYFKGVSSGCYITLQRLR